MNKKEILITTALKLFCENGFNATGIDTILERADVSKATMYNYFKSKDDFITVCLEYAHDLFVANFITVIDGMEISPKDKILTIFQKLYEGMQNKELIRCVFINASAEFSALENPIHKVAMAHKISMQDYIQKLATEANIANPLHFARICTTLSQGALVMAQVSGDRGYYSDILEVVTCMIGGL